jgi:hypothetical protein
MHLRTEGNSCISPGALPPSRLCRELRGRKPIWRGRPAGFSGGRHHRHHCPTDRAMAFRAARTTVRPNSLAGGFKACFDSLPTSIEHIKQASYGRSR